MAYITTMPQSINPVALNEEIEIVNIIPPSKKELISPSKKTSSTIQPKQVKLLKDLKSQLFAENNTLKNLKDQNLKSPDVIPNIPFETSDSLMNSQFKSLMSKPLYPYQAYVNKIDGWVLLKLFITEIGAVENVEVLASNPEGVFENIAVKSAFKKTFPIDANNLNPKKHTRNLRIQYKAGEQFF
ncbi:MAG: energy transducer TonB [Marinicellaceae bacterium]